MNESCCLFGPEKRLAGIITEPSAPGPRQAFVLISAGLLPKHGPYRLYTQLARRLASDGVVSLRSDLGGVGDSIQAASDRPLKERSELEIRAAVDYCSERYPVHDIVLGGLCSGAEDAFRNAARDQRVTGVVLIDPFAYRTSGWGWRHVLHRVGRRTLRALGLYEPIVARRAQSRRRIVTYKYMERAESQSILGALLERNVRVHFVYTAGMREYFNHERQLQAQFPQLDLRGRVTLDYFPHMDHTQLLEADRDTLVEAIARRLRARP